MKQARLDSGLGALLKAKRAALSMTLDEVGIAAGVTKGYVHDLENDKSVPSILICARLSVALGVSVQAMAAAALNGAIRGQL